ncbi:hypothetical protein KJK32_06325 [Streptomyces sp. JCM17656]|nr:hypothetical protein KJK32_06325 [Streptomyces sp. JCM17656]
MEPPRRPVPDCRRALPLLSGRLRFGCSGADVLWDVVRPRVLLTVRPRTTPMKSSTRSVVASSGQARATLDWGRQPASGR